MTDEEDVRQELAEALLAEIRRQQREGEHDLSDLLDKATAEEMPDESFRPRQTRRGAA